MSLKFKRNFIKNMKTFKQYITENVDDDVVNHMQDKIYKVFVKRWDRIPFQKRYNDNMICNFLSAFDIIFKVKDAKAIFDGYFDKNNNHFNYSLIPNSIDIIDIIPKNYSFEFTDNRSNPIILDGIKKEYIESDVITIFIDKQMEVFKRIQSGDTPISETLWHFMIQPIWKFLDNELISLIGYYKVIQK